MDSVNPEHLPDDIDQTLTDVVKVLELGRKLGSADAERQAEERYWEGVADGIEVAFKDCPYRAHRTTRTRVTNRPRVNGALR